MSRTFSDKAYETLFARICSGALRPSMPLDVHRIAQELKMSVTPVRDAIKRLEADGLVDVVPRSGTFVRHFTIADLIQGYELVEGLEGMAGLLTTERIRDGSLLAANVERELRDLNRRMEDALAKGQRKEWGEFDEKFHERICELCGNNLILDGFRSAGNQMKSVLSLITPLYVDRANSVREHHRIIDALVNGDAEATRKLCQSHRSSVRQILRTLL